MCSHTWTVVLTLMFSHTDGHAHSCPCAHSRCAHTHTHSCSHTHVLTLAHVLPHGQSCSHSCSHTRTLMLTLAHVLTQSCLHVLTWTLVLTRPHSSPMCSIMLTHAPRHVCSLSLMCSCSHVFTHVLSPMCSYTDTRAHTHGVVLTHVLTQRSHPCAQSCSHVIAWTLVLTPACAHTLMLTRAHLCSHPCAHRHSCSHTRTLAHSRPCADMLIHTSAHSPMCSHTDTRAHSRPCGHMNTRAHTHVLTQTDICAHTCSHSGSLSPMCFHGLMLTLVLTLTDTAHSRPCVHTYGHSGSHMLTFMDTRAHMDTRALLPMCSHPCSHSYAHTHMLTYASLMCTLIHSYTRAHTHMCSHTDTRSLPPMCSHTRTLVLTETLVLTRPCAHTRARPPKYAYPCPSHTHQSTRSTEPGWPKPLQSSCTPASPSLLLLICSSRRNLFWVSTELKWEQQAAVKLQDFTLWTDRTEAWQGTRLAYNCNWPFS